MLLCVFIIMKSFNLVILIFACKVFMSSSPKNWTGYLPQSTLQSQVSLGELHWIRKTTSVALKSLAFLTGNPLPWNACSDSGVSLLTLLWLFIQVIYRAPGCLLETQMFAEEQSEASDPSLVMSSMGWWKGVMWAKWRESCQNLCHKATKDHRSSKRLPFFFFFSFFPK